ncbi:hypothetical protein BV25DRAFT_1915890 [Artomyces pyxidatus]|uniref:Uncharacterized protein n=1 Tax=Artomyces pyxidatus TaxID=48021 RepID=A0ACB8T1Y6_9AGAM|nr:hypothetical protein BV25DRAFT_1915890 [Artomyces pyxidatus]
MSINGTIPFALASSSSCENIHACRTLFNIVWSSFVTILACVWTAVHRNIPGPAGARESRLQHVATRGLEMAKIFMVTLLVPEWVLAWAVRQFLNARDLGRELQAAREEAERAWDSAGEGKIGYQQVLLAGHKRAGRLNGRWTTRHGFFVIMGGFHLYDDGVPQHPLSREDVIYLVKTGDIVPPTEEEIRGWSQGDALSKTIAVFQTLWFVIQCIARRAQDLPVTQLEVMTLAYTTITVAMYVVWWYKPKNVGGPVRVTVTALPVPAPVRPAPRWKYWHAVVVIAGMQDPFVDLRQQSRIPTFFSGTFQERNEYYADVLALGAAMVFGAVHCAAWDYVFPSGAERFMWRLSSISIIAVPGVLLVALLAWLPTEMGRPDWRRRKGKVILILMSVVTVLSGLVYVAARILLITLSFTTLRSLPYVAYESIQWTLFVPHFT